MDDRDHAIRFTEDHLRRWTLDYGRFPLGHGLIRWLLAPCTAVG